MNFDHQDQQRLEQIVQQTRWDEVADARQRVLDRLQLIDRMQFDGQRQITEERVALLQQRTVQLYIEQVETILDPVDGKTTAWWGDRWIGEFELPDGSRREVIGLGEYVELDEEILVTVEREHRPHGAAMPETREVEVSLTPPPGLHRNAFRATNRALADQGIEFDTRERDVDEDDLDGGVAV